MTEQEFIKGRSIPMTREQELNMERFAEFLARMIQKYGNEVLKEIEAKENPSEMQ